jgi:hypothetical protein
MRQNRASCGTSKTSIAPLVIMIAAGRVGQSPYDVAPSGSSTAPELRHSSRRCLLGCCPCRANRY